MRKHVRTMFVSNNGPSFHLWWKENLVKHREVSKYYETDCWSLGFLTCSMALSSLVSACLVAFSGLTGSFVLTRTTLLLTLRVTHNDVRYIWIYFLWFWLGCAKTCPSSSRKETIKVAPVWQTLVSIVQY